MTSEDLLQSKYDRLCVEFKKLRNKHREFKETTDKELSELKELREKQRTRESHILNLQQECDSLHFRNAQLFKQLRELTAQPASTDPSLPESTQRATAVPSPSITATFETKSNSSPVCLDKKMDVTNDSEPPSACTPDLIYSLDQKNSSTSANTITHSSPPKSTNASQQTPLYQNFSAASGGHTASNDLGVILNDLTIALRDWTSKILSEGKRTNLSSVNGSLVDRIAQLERQVCELSLQCQLEKKRRLMVREQTDTRPSQLIHVNCDENDSSTSVPSSKQESECLVIDALQQRIRSLTDQAQYFAGLATFLQDEISCLTPRIIGLAREAYFHQSEAVKSRALLQKIRSELEQANSNTLRQSTEMAKHIANLTDELQELRCGLNRNHSFDTTSNLSKKSSIFSVLKR